MMVGSKDGGMFFFFVGWVVRMMSEAIGIGIGWDWEQSYCNWGVLDQRMVVEQGDHHPCWKEFHGFLACLGDIPEQSAGKWADGIEAFFCTFCDHFRFFRSIRWFVDDWNQSWSTCRKYSAPQVRTHWATTSGQFEYVQKLLTPFLPQEG